MIEEAEANPQEFFSLEVHNKAIRRLQAEEAAGRLVVHADGSFEDRGVCACVCVWGGGVWFLYIYIYIYIISFEAHGMNTHTHTHTHTHGAGGWVF